MAGAGKLPESTFFNAIVVIGCEMKLFYLFFGGVGGGGKGEGFLGYKEVTTENTVQFRK